GGCGALSVLTLLKRLPRGPVHATRREPLGGRRARRGLALADLISIEDHHPGPGIGELAGDREAGEARTAEEDIGVAAHRRPLLAALGASRRQGERGYFKPLSL